ncbi:MAG: hypothetical protein WC791_02010 [Candidatus Paceibacterota bacterium]|jgi:hypothetical protein
MPKNNQYTVSYKRGAAVITVVLFFVIIATTVLLGVSSPVVSEYKTARDLGNSKSAYYLSEAGLEDVMYRTMKAIGITSPVILTLGGNIATTTATTVSSSEVTVSSVGDVKTNIRKIGVTLSTGVGNEFFYALQAGGGGINMATSSVINGNVFSDGHVCGAGIGNTYCDTADSNGITEQSTITGTVVSRGTTGLNGTINRIINTIEGASMHAGNITNAFIMGSPYCTTNYNSSPPGCETLVAQPQADAPISDADITAWKNAAIAGGNEECDGAAYTIAEDATDLGPRVIPCNLVIDGSSGTDTVTLKGPVWVKGNITIRRSLIIKVDPARTGQSMVMIADKESDHTNSSRIILEGNSNSRVFDGAGENSWVMLLSQNDSAYNSGAVIAIDAQGNTSGDVILMALKGQVQLFDASVASITAYWISILADGVVNYSMGMQSALFYSGPAGSWNTMDWRLGQ